MSDIRFTVRRYLDEDRIVLPVKPGEKATRFPDWPNAKPTLTDFDENDNVAERLDGIVDVDCDSPLTRAAATRLLLETSRKHGRPSAGTTHYFYIAVEGTPKPEVFKDTEGGVLVEIRHGNNQYTLIPPSVLARKDDPSKTEVLEGRDGAPGRVSFDGLRESVAALATAALLAKNWPSGSRHDCAMAVAGFLISRELDEELINLIVKTAAELAKDGEIDDRLTAVRSSIATFQKGGKTTGLPRLGSIIGDDVVKRLRAWWGGEELSRIETTNARFAALSVGSNRVIAEFDETESIVELWKFDDFRKLLIKEPRVSVGKSSKPFADFWLEHPKGRHYDRLVYVMPGSRESLRPNDFNGYHGFTVEPSAGDWSLNRAHILDVICGGDPTIFAWVLNWLAAPVQRPGQHAWSAVVMRGGQGVGKGHFADVLIGKCFHPQQYLHIIGANQLTAEFNEHLSGKVLVFADESTWGGDPKAAAKIKGLVTEDTVPIHRKFLKLIDEPSALHILIASNSEWPIPIDRDDRRFLVLDVRDDRRQDQHYFGALRAELENGGRAAMLHDLLNLTVDWSLLRQPPETDAKRDVKERTLSIEERWLQNFLMNDDGAWTRRIAKTTLYTSYEMAASRRGEPKSRDAFGKFLRKLFRRGGADGWPADAKLTVQSINDVERVNAYEFPALDDCRKAFDKATGTKTDWPEWQLEKQNVSGDSRSQTARQDRNESISGEFF